MGTDTGDSGIGDVLDRVRSAGVFCDGSIGVIDLTAVLVEDDVFEHGPELDRVEHIGFFVRRKAKAFGIAAAFDVGNSGVAPAVLVVADEKAVVVGWIELSFPCQISRVRELRKREKRLWIEDEAFGALRRGGGSLVRWERISSFEESGARRWFEL